MKIAYTLPIEIPTRKQHELYVSIAKHLSFWLDILVDECDSLLYPRWNAFTKDYKEFSFRHHVLFHLYTAIPHLKFDIAVKNFLRASIENIEEINTMMDLLGRLLRYMTAVKEPYYYGFNYLSRDHGSKHILAGFIEIISPILEKHIARTESLIQIFLQDNLYLPNEHPWILEDTEKYQNLLNDKIHRKFYLKEGTIIYTRHKIFEEKIKIL